MPNPKRPAEEDVLENGAVRKSLAVENKAGPNPKRGLLINTDLFINTSPEMAKIASELNACDEINDDVAEEFKSRVNGELEKAVAAARSRCIAAASDPLARPNAKRLAEKQEQYEASKRAHDEAGRDLHRLQVAHDEKKKILRAEAPPGTFPGHIGPFL